jgi:hypothetical protein
MRQGKPCSGKRYVRNLDKREVHDLENEKANCQIDEIKRLQCFDTLAAAKADGSDNCAYCLGNSTR